MLEVADIRKMAIHLACRLEAVEPARVSYEKRLRQLISRAPKIRWW